MEPTVELVKLVARLFYEDKHAVFLDYLLRERMYTRTLMTLLSDRLPDDVLADRMQILLRDVGKIASRLREDRLIKTHVRPEVREYDGKTFSRTYYYIDFALFADVVRYRLYQMRISLEQKVKNVPSPFVRLEICGHRRVMIDDIFVAGVKRPTPHWTPFPW